MKTMLKVEGLLMKFHSSKMYVGSSEAAWRILENPISEHWPPVVGLAVHLENGHRVYFNEENVMQQAQGPPPINSFFPTLH